MTLRAVVILLLGMAGGFLGCMIVVTVVRQRRLEGGISQWLGLPTRYSWMSRRDWLRDCVEIVWDRASHRIGCRMGRHEARFGTWPQCIWCGRNVDE